MWEGHADPEPTPFSSLRDLHVLDQSIEVSWAEEFDLQGGHDYLFSGRLSVRKRNPAHQELPANE